METNFLAIDCGTQSLRALIFSSTGDLLFRVKTEYDPYFSMKPGWAEQDPEIYWKSLCRACHCMKSENPSLFSTIAAIGVTTQRNSMINLDKSGRPLRDAIIWLDQREAAPVFLSGKLLKLLFHILKLDASSGSVLSQGKCNWIREQQHDIWEETFKYLQVSGFLNYRLTGVFRDSTASQIGHIPFHYKRKRWAKRFELPALLFPVEKEKLPELVKPGGIIGNIHPGAALQTGLPQGIPVVACASDKGCETLGAGVTDQKSASLSFGTTATVQTTSETYFEPLRFMPSYPAAVPDCFNPEVEIFRGFWMIKWFKEQFAHKETITAQQRGVAVEEILNTHLSSTPPGSMGLVIQPYWSPGLNHPDARGAMIGFADVHTKAHVFRSIIEGLGFALREGLHTIEKKGKRKVEKVAVSGGASQSDEICQITADIFNLPVLKGKTHETSGLGAAIITSVGMGIHASFREAVKQMVTHDKIFTPDQTSVKIYEALFRKVYRKMYAILEPLYKEMRDITGYPGRK